MKATLFPQTVYGHKKEFRAKLIVPFVDYINITKRDTTAEGNQLEM